jgi:hypothetical protein
LIKRIIRITFVHLGETETPSFVLVEERSLNGSPSIAVTFPDGYQGGFQLLDLIKMELKSHMTC